MNRRTLSTVLTFAAVAAVGAGATAATLADAPPARAYPVTSPTASPTVTRTAYPTPRPSSTVTRTAVPTPKPTVSATRGVSRPAARPAASRVTVALADVLPYYDRPAPAWCAEDMACWIGSTADGRTDAQIAATLADDLAASSRAYAGE